MENYKIAFENSALMPLISQHTAGLMEHCGLKE